MTWKIIKWFLMNLFCKSWKQINVFEKVKIGGVGPSSGRLQFSEFINCYLLCLFFAILYKLDCSFLIKIMPVCHILYMHMIKSESVVYKFMITYLHKNVYILGIMFCWFIAQLSQVKYYKRLQRAHTLAERPYNQSAS